MKKTFAILALFAAVALHAQIQVTDNVGTRNFTETVVPIGSGSGQINNTGAGGIISGCYQSGGTCTGSFTIGTVISLTPTVSGGSTFLWQSASGDMAGCSGSGTCTFTVATGGSIIGVFSPSSGGNVPVDPFFGLGPNQTVTGCSGTGITGGYPNGFQHGTDRWWDSPPLQVPFYYTAVNTWDFSKIDAELCAAARSGTKGILIDFARTPYFATAGAQFTDTSKCSYLKYSAQSGSNPGSGTAITAITESGGTVTVTSTFNPAIGSVVVISGVPGAGNGYNGAFVVATSSGSNFTYSDPTTGLSPGTVSSGSPLTQVAFAGTPLNLTDSGPNQCEPPLDIDSTPQSGLADGSNQTYRNNVAAVISHVYQPGYIAGTSPFTFAHAAIEYTELWNEPDTCSFWSCKYGSYDQLIRMQQDIQCIVEKVTGTVQATGETCAQVRASVSSAAVNASLFTGLSCTGGSGWPTCPLAPSVRTGMAPGHPQGVALNFAQCFLYCGHPAGTSASCSCSGSACNNTAGTPVSCHTGGHASTDWINFHDKEGSQYPTELEPQNATWTAAIEGILATAEQALPLYDTEDAYSTCGWPGTSQCPASNAPPYQYTDNQASFVSRTFLTRWSTGWTGIWFYNWKNTAGGIALACTSSSDDCAMSAWNTTYNWMAGSSMGTCTTSGTLVTCPITLATGKTGYIMYNYASSYYCTASTAASCPTTPYTPPAGPTTYYDLHGDPGVTLGTCPGCTGRQFPLGIKPTLITN